MKIQNKGLNFY